MCLYVYRTKYLPLPLTLHNIIPKPPAKHPFTKDFKTVHGPLHRVVMLWRSSRPPNVIFPSTRVSSVRLATPLPSSSSQFIIIPITLCTLTTTSASQRMTAGNAKTPCGKPRPQLVQNWSACRKTRPEFVYSSVIEVAGVDNA